MTCHSLNIDAAVADRAQLEALALLLDNQAPASGRAKTTATQPSNGALNGMIASRCSKMQFRSNEARKRFLQVHRALATYSEGDA